MRKIYLLLLLCCINMVVNAQTTTITNGYQSNGAICNGAGISTPVYSFALVQSGSSATLTSVNFNTTGSYGSADISGFGLKMSSANYYGSAVPVAGASIVTGLGTGSHTFTGISVPMVPTGTPDTIYFWVTATTSSATILAPTLQVSTFSTANITVSTGTKLLGAINAGGIFTINSLLPIIPNTGLSMCAGDTLALVDSNYGGNWTISGGTGTFAFTGSGVDTNRVFVYGIFGSTFAHNVNYSIGSCVVSVPVLVHSNPLPITGDSSVCYNNYVTLSDASGGGNWEGTGVSIDWITGVVLGTTVGTALITYTDTNGCYVNLHLTVNPLPNSITGPDTVCAGDSVHLSDATTNGTWSSSNTSSVTINSVTGWEHGIALGTDTIYFTSNVTGCKNFLQVRVSSSGPITGPDSICVGQQVTYTDTSLGGMWISGSTSIATVNAVTGAVTGIAQGVDILTYTAATGCRVTKTITVNPLPAAITGPTSVCKGSAITLSDATSSGTWVSINPTIGSVATISSVSAIDSGKSAGIDSIKYSTALGCSVYYVVTVKPLPDSFSGGPKVCLGSTITLSDAVTGGTWSSSNIVHATVGSVTGIVTGVSLGLDTITYTITATTCYITDTIRTIPYPSPISGPTYLCANETVTLSDATTGGIWHSSSSGIAGIDATLGILTGVSAGRDSIYYSVGGCSVYRWDTVKAIPPFPVGPTVVCQGSSISISDISTSGGTWSATPSSIATVNPISGVVTGVSGGLAAISYTDPTLGCSSILMVTVNPLPAPIVGPTDVCLGLTVTLTDATTGGTWSNNNFSLDTINATTGVDSARGVGADTITYTLTATGCLVTRTLTIDPLPTDIYGPDRVCIGYTISLNDTSAGGSWSSSNYAVANVGTLTGVVTGVDSGVVTITYTIGSGCIKTHIVSVNPNPPAITGTNTFCSGAGITLTDSLADGHWGSANSSIASTTSIGYIGIIIAGSTTVGGGTIIADTNAATGCYITYPVTINPEPAAIIAPDTICVGVCVTIYDSTSGGTWLSTNPGTATITPLTGNSALLCGITSAGGVPVTIALFNSFGCQTHLPIVVADPPTSVIGTDSVCVFDTVNLTDGTTGGYWAVTNTTIANIYPDGFGGGNLVGLATGVDSVIYHTPGCTIYYPITVDLTPPPITGPTSVCVGSTITLNDGITGGAWWTTESITTLTPSGSMVQVFGDHWMAGGDTAIIGYTIGNCSAKMIVTVNPSPVMYPRDTASICVGNVLLDTLSLYGTGVGTWSSTNTSIATVSSVVYTSALITGVNSGLDTLYYTDANNCKDTLMLTVNSVANITGPTTICDSVLVSYSASIAGGTWTTSDNTIATVTTGGLVTGLTPGTGFYLVYTLPTGACADSLYINVINMASITGPGSVCVGQSATLADATTGGTWSSSNTSLCTIGATSGIDFGVAAGTVTITYNLAPGCRMFKSVNVYPLTPITGVTHVCQYLSDTLFDATTGGIWSSSDATIATVDNVPYPGLVKGIRPGVVTIYYVNPFGCHTSVLDTVRSVAHIAGIDSVCIGATITMTDTEAIPGVYSLSSSIAAITAQWYSSSIGVDYVSIIGVTTGSNVLTYTVTSGPDSSCIALDSIFVNPNPTAIYGPDSAVCAWGDSIILYDSSDIAHGVWSSTLATVVGIAPGTGKVFGLGAGLAIVSYSLPSGCFSTKFITVNPLPTPIYGLMYVCQGDSILMHDSTILGSWSANPTTIGTITAGTGWLTGRDTGTVLVSYTIPTGCLVTMPVTVNPRAIIQGDSSMCLGTSYIDSDFYHGGTWSVGSTAICSLTTTAFDNKIIVTGIAVGTTILTYTMPTGCASYFPITVNPNPSVITGNPPYICQGDSVQLFDITTGGTWSSSNSAIAIVNSTMGFVTGEGGGMDTISYTLPTGCWDTVHVNIHAIGRITGPPTDTVCSGIWIQFYDAVSGGVWSNDNSSIDIISATGADFGLVIGGTDSIRYTVNGCMVAKGITVNPVPAAIVGTDTLCAGNSITLTDATTGGVWTTVLSNATISSQNSSISRAIVMGNATSVLKVDTVVYTYIGCPAKLPVTVNPLPAPIIGPNTVCATQTIVLIDASTGSPYAWTSSNNLVATVGTTTGLVGGISATTPTAVTINFTAVTSGCFVTHVVTVNPLSLITGPDHVCLGVPTPFTDATPGGTWYSSNPGVASVGATTGMVTGLALGTTTIDYIMPVTHCMASIVVSVVPSPHPIDGVAPHHVCVGGDITLTDFVTGGTWSSSLTSVATIGSASGVCHGVSSGTTIITYQFGATGCRVITSVIVNPLTATHGDSFLCVGDYDTLYNPSLGGVWVSSNPSWATINPTNGELHAIGTGGSSLPVVVIINYTIPGGCVYSYPVTINPIPGIVIGTRNVFCTGDSSVLTASIGPGTWSSSNRTWGVVNQFIDSILYNTGKVYAQHTGLDTILFTVTSTGCKVGWPITVNPQPGPITGLFWVCPTYTSLLLNDSTPGTWSSSNSAIASINSASGLTTGISSGLDTITFTMPGGCYSTHQFLVNPALTPTDSIVSSVGTMQLVGGIWHNKICNDEIPVFTAKTTNGGLSPTYHWIIQNSLVIKKDTTILVDSTYAYPTSLLPVANNDTIYCTVTSDAPCIAPATYTDMIIMDVQPTVPISVSLTYSGGSPICEGTPVTVIATASTAGSTDYYIWQVNGVNQGAATTHTATFNVTPTPLYDSITCFLMSSVYCARPDTAFSSNAIQIRVNPSMQDTLHIYYFPSGGGTTVVYGETVLFTSEGMNFGSHPDYQWFLNGAKVIGATNSTWLTSSLHYGYNYIYLRDSSNNPCTSPVMDSSNVIIIYIFDVGVQGVSNGFNEISLQPNPNTGKFELIGSLNSVYSGDVAVEVTDMLGKLIYKDNIAAKNGKLNSQIKLDDNVPAGIYYLRLSHGAENDIRHFVIEK